MTWTKLSSTDAGAPTLWGVNGAMNNVLRWALPQIGWEVEFGATGNDTVFRAATGNRMRLSVRHNSALTGADPNIAVVRGCETATSATAIASLFPTTTQIANINSNWVAGADATTQLPYLIYGNGTFFYFLVKLPSYGWELHYFGDVPSDYATGFDTVICVRNYGSWTGSFGATATCFSYTSPNSNEFWARGVNATTKSTMGNRASSQPGGALGNVQNAPIPRGGYLNRIMREKVSVHCAGSVTAAVGSFAIIRRGWLPNLWNPLHLGVNSTIADGDTFTDTAYNAAASFRWFAFNGGNLIIEETDTWDKP